VELPGVATLDPLRMEQRERRPGRGECPLRQAHQNDRILATGEQEHRPLELRGHFTKDVNGLGFKLIEVAAVERRRSRDGLRREGIDEGLRHHPF